MIQNTNMQALKRIVDVPLLNMTELRYLIYDNRL